MYSEKTESNLPDSQAKKRDLAERLFASWVLSEEEKIDFAWVIDTLSEKEILHSLGMVNADPRWVADWLALIRFIRSLSASLSALEKRTNSAEGSIRNAISRCEEVELKKIAAEPIICD